MVVSVIVFVLILIYMNFDDMSWAANKGNYLGLLACLVNIWALGFLIKDTSRRSR
jgi:hypothetical protein